MIYLARKDDYIMTTIEYFKLQAKNLFRDWKTKVPIKEKIAGKEIIIYEYSPKYFDIDQIVCDFDLDEDNFTLMQAQHVIAILAGFDSWADLLKSSEAKLEIGKILLDNRDKIMPDDWWQFIGASEDLSSTIFSDETKLALCEYWIKEYI